MENETGISSRLMCPEQSPSVPVKRNLVVSQICPTGYSVPMSVLDGSGRSSCPGELLNPQSPWVVTGARHVTADHGVGLVGKPVRYGGAS